MFVFKRSDIAAEPCFFAARSTRDSSRSRFALCGGACATSNGRTERLRFSVAISVSEGEATYLSRMLQKYTGGRRLGCYKNTQGEGVGRVRHAAVYEARDDGGG